MAGSGITLATGLTVLSAEDGGLLLRLRGGADALGDAREFTLPLEDRHLAVLRDDLQRQVLLVGTLLTQCDAAGSRGPLDQRAAVPLLDPLLFGERSEIDARCRGDHHVEQQVVAFGGDTELLDRGEVFAASRTVTETSDWNRVRLHEAHRERAARGVVLGALDTAVLQYTGRYLGRSERPLRDPDAVDPVLLPQVLRVIATAERARGARRIDPVPRRGLLDVTGWQRRRLTRVVRAAVRRAHPELVDDAVRAVCQLMATEAGESSRRPPPPRNGTAGERRR